MSIIQRKLGIKNSLLYFSNPVGACICFTCAGSHYLLPDERYGKGRFVMARKKADPAKKKPTPKKADAPTVEKEAPAAAVPTSPKDSTPVSPKGTAPAKKDSSLTAEKTTPAPAVEKPASKKETPTQEIASPAVEKAAPAKKAAASKKAATPKPKAAPAEKEPAPAEQAAPKEPAPVAEEPAGVQVLSELPRRSVAFIGSECHPFVKTGGLGDVMYALPRELVRLNCDVRVILPRYACIPQKY